ncbi:MAG: uroporphyrinogen decarboxylase family protein, partial [Planctomycetota bacterium]
ISGIPLREVLQRGELLAEVLVSAQSRYGHDLVLIWCDMTLEAESLGAKVVFEDGLFPDIVGTMDFRRVDWSFEASRGRLSVMIDAVETARKALPEGVGLAASLKGPLSLAALVGGVEDFLQGLISDPHGARRAIEGATVFQSGFASALARAGAVPWFGDPLASGDMLGQRWFRPFALPALEAVVDEAQGAAGKAAVHICGDPAAILADLKGVGADWWSLEVRDMEGTKSQLPDALLLGGMPTDLLLRGQEEEVYRQAREVARSMPGNCVLATDCDVPERSPEVNVAAMIRGARDGFEARELRRPERGCR